MLKNAGGEFVDDNLDPGEGEGEEGEQFEDESAPQRALTVQLPMPCVTPSVDSGRSTPLLTEVQSDAVEVGMHEHESPGSSFIIRAFCSKIGLTWLVFSLVSCAILASWPPGILIPAASGQSNMHNLAKLRDLAVAFGLELTPLLKRTSGGCLGSQGRCLCRTPTARCCKAMPLLL